MILNQYIHIAIFTGGIFPEPEETKNIWQNFPLPEYIIAADSGIDTLENYTKLFPFFKPNKIVGDFDSEGYVEYYCGLGHSLSYGSFCKDYE